MLAVQSKEPDGSWKNVLQSSFYDTGSVKYDSCVSLAPSASSQFTGVGSRLLLLKKQLTGLGNQPTLRFNIMTLCKQPDGGSVVSLSKGFSVLSKDLMTDPFDLQLPEPPK